MSYLLSRSRNNDEFEEGRLVGGKKSNKKKSEISTIHNDVIIVNDPLTTRWQKLSGYKYKQETELTTPKDIHKHLNNNKNELKKSIGLSKKGQGIQYHSSFMMNGSSTMNGGANILPIINDPYIGRFLEYTNIFILTPTTLIPLGILLFYYLSCKKPQNGGFKNITKKINEINEKQKMDLDVNKDDYRKYLKIRKINKVDDMTKFPFALVMGNKMFHNYIKSI